MTHRSFTNEQLEAISVDAKEVFISAGAGTGKTTVIIERAMRLAKAGKRILVTTFSITARQELQHRIAQHADVLSGAVDMDLITIATSGSIAWQVLNEVYPEYTLLSQSQAYRKLIEVAEKIGIVFVADKYEDVAESDKKRREFYRYISNAVNLLTVNDIQVDDIEIPEDIAPLYKAWHETLVDEKICDANAMLRMTLDAILEKSIPEKWLGFDEILGDEAQDFSMVQYLTLLQMASHSSGNLTLVGDNAQAIYSWRGALPSLLTPSNMGENGAFIELTHNFRSTKQILAPALAVVNSIPGMEKRLVSEVSGPAVSMKVLQQVKKEADYIAERCLDLLEGNKIPLHEIAIMGRSHSVLNETFSALSKHNLPFVYIGNTFFKRPEYKIIRSVSDILSGVSPFQEMTRTVHLYLGKDIKIGPEDGLSVYDAARKALSRYPSSKRLMNALAVAHERIAVGGKFAHQFNSLMDDMGLFDQMRRQPGGNHTAHTLTDLREMSINYSDWPSFRAGLLERENTGQGQKPMEGHIFVGTPFAAKGKEFHTAFVMGLNEGVFPSPFITENEVDYRYDVMRSGGYDEEKRMLFVAITRAKKNCILTWSRKRRNGPVMQDLMPSSLLYLTGLKLPR